MPCQKGSIKLPKYQARKGQFDAMLAFRDLLEGVSVAGLLHGLDNRLVDAEGDGDAEQCQQQVGGHADEAEGRQRQQQQHGHAEHQARLLGVSPVDQVLDCGEGGYHDIRLLMMLCCEPHNFTLVMTFHSLTMS